MYLENLHSPLPGNGGLVCSGFISRESIFFRMEVVSHLLFEACRKIIPQLQTAVAELREQDKRMQKEMQLEVGSGNEKCSRITCTCLCGT